MSEASVAPGSPAAELRGELKIKEIRAQPVQLPMSYVYRWGPGAFHGIVRNLVEVETTDGIVGIGESGQARHSALVEQVLAPRLIGADPLDLAGCERLAIPSLTGLVTVRDLVPLNAYAGIEMALWDIAGKASGRSLSSLLGGRVRDRVAFTEYFALEADGDDDPQTVADYCANAAKEFGADTFEGKVGVLSLPEELEMVRAIRAGVGEDKVIRLDANMSWDLATARQALPAFAELGVSWVEEPVATATELRQLAGVSPISYSSHQIDLPLAVRDGVPGAFAIMIGYLGGIRRTVEFAAACAMFGIAVWFRAPNTGVSTAAEIHIAAAMEKMGYPSQNLCRWLGDEIIAEGQFLPQDGGVEVPDGPGLGVTLDPDAVARAAERARSGPIA